MATPAINLTLALQALLADGTDVSTAQHLIPITQIGKYAQKYNAVVTTSDASLSIGPIGTIGLVLIENRGALVIVTTPATPLISPQGAAGATSYTYVIVAKQTDGSYSAGSTGGSTSTGNATLTSSNFNQITWVSVPGAASYDVYRSASGGTPSSTGKIGNTTGTLFNDTGLAGDSTVAPATGIDNVVLIGALASPYNHRMKGGDAFLGRWNAAAIHVKSNTSPTVPITITIIED